MTMRRADPYSIYDRLEFDVCTRNHGDVYDRYLVRLDEIRQSLRILQQVLRDIPEGPILTGKPTYMVKVPAGESYGRVEGPKGELGYYMVSQGKAEPVALPRPRPIFYQPDQPGGYVQRPKGGRCGCHPWLDRYRPR